MRIVCLLLLLTSLASADEGPTAPQPGTRAALEALLPSLEDWTRTSEVGAAFLAAADRKLAISVLDDALLHPDIPIGHAWASTRAALERDPDHFGGGADDAPYADWPRQALSPEEQATWLGKVAAALPLKRATALAPSFGVLVAFHHASPHIAPAAARAWRDLDETTRAYLLGDEGWPLIKSDVMKAQLMDTPDETAERGVPWHVQHARSLALRRLVEMGSAPARKLILADMRRTAPRLTHDALLALDDVSLPALEDDWRKALADRAHRNLTKLAPLLERYASRRMRKDVLALVRGTPGWACDIQAALLGYLLKHDEPTGLAEVTAALARRSAEDTGCYRYLLAHVLPGHWSPAVEALARHSLKDPDHDVRLSAARALNDR